MESSIVRIVASPPVAPHTLEDIAASLSRAGSLRAAVNDPDINASVVTLQSGGGDYTEVVDALSDRMTLSLTAGRAFRIELMAAEPEKTADEAVRSVAVALHGLFQAPVYVARRDKPAAAWAFVRPMPWGRKGLAVGQSAPTLPFSGSECLGVSLELGTPTVLAKARLEGVSEHGLVQACAAVGGADSGFAEVGAYPAVSAADGASVVVLEFGHVVRSPMHRAFAVLDIEARRFGGRLGQAAILSHVPLGALLDALKAETGLSASPAQVLETHLPKNRVR